MEDVKDDGTEQDPSSSISETATPSQQDEEMAKTDPVKRTRSSHWRKCIIVGTVTTLSIIGMAVGLGVGLKRSGSSAASSSVPSKEQDGQEQMEQHYIDYSCEQDSDCEVMDVGSCCGYNPECLHKTSTPDPSIGCEYGGSSVCGFLSIEKCVCDTQQLGGKCQAFDG
jgi:hypothetical protein